jgi:hypothetical protein
MAGIAQRAVSANTSNSDSFFDPSEMQALLDEHKSTQETSNKLLEQGETVKKQIEG